MTKSKKKKKPVSHKGKGFQATTEHMLLQNCGDYIMEKMLKNSKVANISGSYLSENKEGTTPGIPLDLGDSKVIFGFILHKGEEMDESVAELVEFLKSRLPKH